jgi:hypothetical protein
MHAARRFMPQPLHGASMTRYGDALHGDDETAREISTGLGSSDRVIYVFKSGRARETEARILSAGGLKSRHRHHFANRCAFIGLARHNVRD